MLIDLSHQLENGILPFPGDPNFNLDKIASIAKDGYCNYQLTTGLHIGTHIDGIAHIIESDEIIASSKLEKFYGKAVILDYRDAVTLDYSAKLEHVDVYDKIVLFFTNHNKHWGSTNYFSNHPVLTTKLANWLIDRGVKMVGIDFPSPDKHPFEVHKLLLSNRIPILENLTNLETLLEAKHITLMAFPLKLSADSSPVRAVVEI